MNLRKQYKMIFKNSTAMENFNDTLDNIKYITDENRGELMVSAVNLYYKHLLEGRNGKGN